MTTTSRKATTKAFHFSTRIYQVRRDDMLPSTKTAYALVALASDSLDVQTDTKAAWLKSEIMISSAQIPTAPTGHFQSRR